MIESSEVTPKFSSIQLAENISKKDKKNMKNRVNFFNTAIPLLPAGCR